jgi:AcrR family transcriptional regulator
VARMSADERRAVLVDAAIRVMKRRGVANTSTRDVVAEAGMQIGVFHYCFHSKEHMIREVMRAINERSYSAVGGVLGEVAPGAELIHAAVMAYWRHIEADPNEHLLTYELTLHALRNLRAGHLDDAPAGADPDDAVLDVVAQIRRGPSQQDDEPDAALAQYRNYLDGMEALLLMLADVCRTKWRTPLPELSRLVLAAIEGITLQWLVDGDGKCATSSLHQLADILVRDADLA